MAYRVVLYLDLLHDLSHCSKIITGLDALARGGLVRFRIRPARNLGYVLLLHVTSLGDKARKWIALDLKDHSDVFSEIGLARSDVYLKRSFHRPDIQRLPAAHRSKILPFGLNYPCSSASSLPLCLRGWGNAVWRQFCSAPRSALRQAWRLLDNLHVYLVQPDYRRFEQPPGAAMEPVVLFQTRVWEPEPTTEDLHAINEERVGLIRFLRRALGSRFRGGIVPTAYAREHYPDVLALEAYRREDYLCLGRRCLIGIYTRGLHHSLAFKLPEYLAASLCIVSDPLRNQLPQPLIAGVHFLEFRTAEECLAQCERLLTHPDEAMAMRGRNWDYYRRWVAPPAHVLDCLTRIFADAG